MKSFISTCPPSSTLGVRMSLTGFSETEAIAAARYYLQYNYRTKICYLTRLYFWIDGEEEKYQTINIGEVTYSYALSL